MSLLLIAAVHFKGLNVFEFKYVVAELRRGGVVVGHCLHIPGCFGAGVTS